MLWRDCDNCDTVGGNLLTSLLKHDDPLNVEWRLYCFNLLLLNVHFDQVQVVIFFIIVFVFIIIIIETVPTS